MDLRLGQELPLDVKINVTRGRIKEWYDHWQGQVYVAFSGGKDSTVLLHLVRDLYPEVPGVFCDTGLEYPEIRDFVKTFDNITWLKPKLNFKETIEKYGYPVVSKEIAKGIREVRTTKSAYTRNKRLYGKNNKRKSGKISEKWKYLINAPFKVSEKCCDVFKKRPSHKYEKDTGRRPYIGTMVGDSSLRMQSVARHGCNAFDMNNPQSRPMSLWTEDNVWEFIKSNNISYCKIYDMGEDRTGCMFCLFGLHFDKHPNRFERMKSTHPKQYKYCMDNLGLGKVIDFLNNKNEKQTTLFKR